MPDILEVDSVIKSFYDNQVLTDIYLKCQTGDIIGILGSNGAGKTTLFKILFGTLHAENSFIKINGKIYEKPYLTPGLLTFLPQEDFIPKQLTLQQVAGLYLGKNTKEFFGEEEILEKVRYSKIANLSGGEMRYFAIKLILNLSSKFVLLDEPFNGVSPLIIGKIKNMIKNYAQNKGIILTDHDYRNVIDISNRLMLLRDGGLKIIKEQSELIRWGYLRAKIKK
jgi:lipopolysaccharide export system ATP-binding protein